MKPMQRPIQVKDPFDGKARGRVRVRSVGRDGAETVLFEQSNTVVEGIYQVMLSQLLDVPGDLSRELVAQMVLGDNPAPTSFTTEFSDMVPISYHDVTEQYPSGTLTDTIHCEWDFDEGNGVDGAQRTYYEIGLISTAGRLLARIVPRNPDDSIRGIVKSTQHKLIVDWTIYWSFGA